MFNDETSAVIDRRDENYLTESAGTILTLSSRDPRLRLAYLAARAAANGRGTDLIEHIQAFNHFAKRRVPRSAG